VRDCDAKHAQCPIDCLAQYPISFDGQGTDTNNLPRSMCNLQCDPNYDTCVTGCGARIETVAAGQAPGGSVAGGAGAGQLAVGDRVSCNWKGGGTFYDGRVAELRGSNVFINYDDGDVEETSPSMCRVLEKAGGTQVASGGSLAAGSRVSCNWKGGGTFYDGRVGAVRPNGRVLINYDDGDVEETTPDRCRALGGGGATASQSAAPTGGGLSGNYTIASAQNPGGGAAYTGSVRISRVGEVYQLAWTIPGTPPYSGVGIEMNGVLAVGWSSGGSPGVVVYQVNGGQLSGKWSQAGGGGVPGVENLSGAPGLSGSFQITSGQNPRGGSYTGSVAIAKNGDTYSLSWTLPRESYAGVGILRGDVLAVGWGGGSGVVSYQVNGTRLDGVWADGRGGALGSEVLEKR
jgi:hypothetical protein